MKLSCILFCCLLTLFRCSGQNATVLTNELAFTDEELKGDILFIGGYHGVHNHKGELAVAKQDHDFTGYIPINGRSDSGYVIVNHELIISDPILGDGGGMTVFTVYLEPTMKRWVVVDDEKGRYRNVDFSEVGGTLDNCGGFQTSWGTVITAEEGMHNSNSSIYLDGSGITDTSDYIVKEFNGAPVHQAIRRYENFDWLVEVDVANAKAIRKNYNMGRAAHEGGVLLADGKTVFITDDQIPVPGFFYKFVAYQSYDLSKGQLYVYRQSENGIGGAWLEMPMDLKSMINARETAAKLGATMFNRTEWAITHNGKVYFTETGNDDSGDQFNEFIEKGARLALHLTELDKEDGQEDGRIHDYYGRILEMDLETNHIRVYLAGGQGGTHHFANPDGLAFAMINGHPILMINEDLTGHSHGRVPAGYNERINEIFCLDLSKVNPSIDDLHKLAIGLQGCETTGGRFTPDGSHYFVNIQHPKSENKFPFNNSVTVAVRNIDKWVAKNVLNERLINETKEVYSLSRNKSFTFDNKTTFQVFNMAGDLIMDGKSKTLSFHGLHRGKYTLLLDDKLQPLVIR